jgi:hypothetical protein
MFDTHIVQMTHVWIFLDSTMIEAGSVASCSTANSRPSSVSWSSYLRTQDNFESFFIPVEKKEHATSDAAVQHCLLKWSKIGGAVSSYRIKKKVIDRIRELVPTAYAPSEDKLSAFAVEINLKNGDVGLSEQVYKGALEEAAERFEHQRKRDVNDRAWSLVRDWLVTNVGENLTKEALNSMFTRLGWRGELNLTALLDTLRDQAKLYKVVDVLGKTCEDKEFVAFVKNYLSKAPNGLDVEFGQRAASEVENQRGRDAYTLIGILDGYESKELPLSAELSTSCASTVADSIVQDLRTLQCLLQDWFSSKQQVTVRDALRVVQSAVYHPERLAQDLFEHTCRIVEGWNNPKILRPLIDVTINTDGTVLHWVVWCGSHDTKLFDTLLKLGADPQVRWKRQTPLELAREEDNSFFIEYMEKYFQGSAASSSTVRDPQGTYALLLSCFHGHCPLRRDFFPTDSQPTHFVSCVRVYVSVACY